ncbi:unnamed protein product [Leptosia nina]|uniref:Uncharacterized protein n=1 Tax=Leptosia nina TaxID=320188 RepID=A0AAV1JL38_9NEOP
MLYNFLCGVNSPTYMRLATMTIWRIRDHRKIWNNDDVVSHLVKEVGFTDIRRLSKLHLLHCSWEYSFRNRFTTYFSGRGNPLIYLNLRRHIIVKDKS